MCVSSHSRFFFNDTATTEIYTLSLHDALPISPAGFVTIINSGGYVAFFNLSFEFELKIHENRSPNISYRKYLDYDSDRKSTRLNSSHANISYAVFCLKKEGDTSSAIPSDCPGG